MSIAYVEHPVSKEQKKEIMSKGFKIVDVRYKPEEIGEDDEVLMHNKPEKKAKDDDIPDKSKADKKAK